MIKNFLICRLSGAELFWLALPGVKYGLQLKWPSAALVVLTAPFYSLTWLASPESSRENLFHRCIGTKTRITIYTGRGWCAEQPDGS